MENTETLSNLKNTILNQNETSQELLAKMEESRIESSKKRQEYIRENTIKWLDEGEKYRNKRIELGLSLRDVGEMLGTSATRIRAFEVGNPVSQVNHLKASYNLLFDYIELQSFILEFKVNVSKNTDILFDNMITIYNNRR